jgi:hypothetical protein
MGTRGDCRLTLRQQCTGTGADCGSNNCEPTVGNSTQICCAQSCIGNRPFCRSDGSSCTQCESNADCGNGCNAMGLCNDLLAIGSACGSTSQCGSNALCLLDQNRQTRCCERNCAEIGQVCNGNGRCVLPTVGAGQACTPGVVGCTGNFQCINSTCQLPVVGQGQACGAAALCNGNLGLECLNGVCNCASNERFVDGRCGLADGQACQQAAECASGVCTLWLVDVDGDGFGSLESVGGQPARRVCGAATEANRPQDHIFVDGCRGNDVTLSYSASDRGVDCCDQVLCGQLGVILSDQAFPGRSSPLTGAANCAPGVFTSDFNCDGEEELVDQRLPFCAALPNAITAAQCSARSGFAADLVCGLPGARQGCGLVEGLCAFVAGVASQQPLCL